MIELAICSALFSLFLDFCMNEGNILSWYYRLIQWLPDWVNKPLGTCVYCFSSWIFIIMYSLWVQKIPCLDCNTVNFIGLFKGLGINFIIIKTADKLGVL